MAQWYLLLIFKFFFFVYVFYFFYAREIVHQGNYSLPPQDSFQANSAAVICFTKYSANILLNSAFWCVEIKTIKNSKKNKKIKFKIKN